MMNLADVLAGVKGADARQELIKLRSYFSLEFPDTMKALRVIDSGYREPKQRKGYNLVKRENRKTGFVYYVRYRHGGKMLPSKWNTHTNIHEEAEKFALANRERLVGRYLKEHDQRGFELFERFYKEGSEYLACEEKRNRPISESTRVNYHSVITRKFIPFMRGRRINCYERVDVRALGDFQDYYLARGIKPQTVNDYLKAVKRVFLYLARKGLVMENPCSNLRSIPVRQHDKELRGCYEVERLEGAFNKRWSDQRLYLLCLLIYTTGMRNCEIGRIRMRDIISLEGCRFIDIKESKTDNGVRMVPLHEKVYRKLKEYGSGKDPEGPVFGKSSSVTFSKANRELARILKADKAAAEQNITFYSGRHFWKTLMNSEGLGEDVEEVFMGHKVSNDVAKLYNHWDKQGKKLMVKKAKQVFQILDKRLFGTSRKQR
jgi:integrase